MRGVLHKVEQLGRPAIMIQVALPATCGELLQGHLDGADFHVTCPVAVYGAVRILAQPRPAAVRLPRKAEAALVEVLRTLRVNLSPGGMAALAARIQLVSRLPQAKGMASSSVDVLGVVLAVGRLLGRAWTPAEASRLALAVEPTDGIAFPGLVLFDHRHGTRCELLGSPPPLRVVVIEPRQRVETVAFNRQVAAPRNWSHHAPAWRDAVAMMRHGVRHGDARAMGAAASLSAQRWQAILPHPWLPEILALGRRHGAVGVCRAHSGSVLGLLFAPAAEPAPSPLSVLKPLRRGVRGGARIWETCLVGGGAL